MFKKNTSKKLTTLAITGALSILMAQAVMAAPGGFGGGPQGGQGFGGGPQGGDMMQEMQRPEGEMPEFNEGERPELPEGELPELSEGEMPEKPEGEMLEGERPELPEGEDRPRTRVPRLRQGRGGRHGRPLHDEPVCARQVLLLASVAARRQVQPRHRQGRARRAHGPLSRGRVRQRHAHRGG